MRCYAKVFVITCLAGLISACWQQQDRIAVTADGMLHVSSEATVNDTSMSREDVEKVAEAVLEDFIEAGWQMEKRWLSEEKPYRLAFTGKARVEAIQDVDNFYRIQATENGNYSVQFLLAGEGDNRVQRSIVLQTDDGVQWLDKNNEPVQGIRPVDGESRYTLQIP